MARDPYPSDLTDNEWEKIEPLLPGPMQTGRPRTNDYREVWNALFYIARTGCQWRYLPHDFLPYSSVYRHFREWRDDGTFESINDFLRKEVRVESGKKQEPTAAILDSRSVKTTEVGGEHGYDAGKKVNGRKQHILVDTLGMILAMEVQPADVQDRDGAKSVLLRAKRKCPNIQLVWADSGYRGILVYWVSVVCAWTLSIVTRPNEIKGFIIQKWRWIVERTFAWLQRSRRLSKDYEIFPKSNEAWCYVVMTRIMVRRLAVSG